MRALTVLQPWAALIVLGAKRIETRSWQTRYRGRLAIHASTRRLPALFDLCRSAPFRSVLMRSPWERLPCGVLGTVELRACVRVEELDAVSATERSFGNFTPGRWAWLLADAQLLPEPVPARGRPGLFEIDTI